MKTRNILLLALTFFSITSCDVLLKTASTFIDAEKPLTAIDVASGLKEALRVGVDTAVVNLNKTNGYFLDQAIKIELPPETNIITDYASKIPGINALLDNMVEQINRSAEDAAAQAAPVFKDAILSMSFDDAWTILNGSDNAATEYLTTKTSAELMRIYRPIMAISLKKPLVGDVSAYSSWNDITSKWNKFANSFAGKLVNLEPVTTNLDAYVTEKALSGLYLKIADQEREIRTNADARVNSILEKVFARQD
ncbi:MAG: DUF4197 domain-containing protein [Prolixibacteraceae bacterium]|jgi:hypothetical protein|nr:DUF4197 domain-containing protein [Prolixibacteraceae bacterium]